MRAHQIVIDLAAGAAGGATWGLISAFQRGIPYWFAALTLITGAIGISVAGYLYRWLKVRRLIAAAAAGAVGYALFSLLNAIVYVGSPLREAVVGFIAGAVGGAVCGWLAEAGGERRKKVLP